MPTFHPTKNNNRGFTLIEMLAAIAIIGTGIMAVFMAVQSGLKAIDYSNARLTAAGLAQEGVEIVKNIRDTNFLKHIYLDPDTGWTEGLSAGEFEVEYKDPHTTNPQLTEPYCSPNCTPNDLRYLRKTSGEFYNYSIGEDTRFKRKLRIEEVDLDQLKLIITVYWRTQAGNYNQADLIQHIYNWRGI